MQSSGHVHGGHDSRETGESDERMNCKCEYISDGQHKQVSSVATCGLHHWREKAAYLAGVRAALAATEYAFDNIAIERALVPERDYIDSHFGPDTPVGAPSR